MFKHVIYLASISALYLEAGIAKHKPHNPQWKEIAPDIVKQLLPEDSRETIDKLFPPKGKKNKYGIEEYHEDTTLSGKMPSPIHIYGEGHLNSVQTKEKIEIEEAALIKKSQIDSLTVKGSLQAKDSTFKNLKGEDSATLKNCKVTGKSQVEGKLTAEHTTFQETLSIGGQSGTLKVCTCQDIRLLPSSKTQTVILDKTKVKGNIVFEGKPGKVILKKNSEISGKVKNGVIRTEHDDFED